MNLGHRFFVVDGDSVVRLSQKTFNYFYFREAPALPQFAGSTIVVVLVIYELKNRKPERIVRMDTQRMKVNDDGSIDKGHLDEGLDLALGRTSFGYEEEPPSRDRQTSVVHAKKLFDERRWKQRHPELSGPALKMILIALFGPGGAH